MPVFWKNLDVHTWDGKLLDYLFNRGLLVAVFLCVGYIFIGTLFYNFYDGFGWIGGINYAISIAFTIGWATDLHEKDDWSYLFSTVYIFGGLLMLSGIFIFIAHLERIHPTPWYVKRANDIERMQLIKSLDNAHESWHSAFERVRLFYMEYESPIISWTVLFLFAVLGVIGTCLRDKIDVIESIYFILSTITTTGIYNPFPDGDSVYYLLMSAYMIVGVIIGGTALVYISDVVVKSLMYVRLNRQFDVPVASQEVQAMKEMTISPPGPQTKLSRQEYVIMMAIRMDIMDEALVSTILQQYDEIPPIFPTEGSVPITNNPMNRGSDNQEESSKLLP